jgi:adenine phosphoribosyltransferase
MSDPLNLKKHIREVKDFPIEGINFRDITSLIENPEAFQTTCKELIEVSKNFNASVITSIESRGFIFAGSISFELGLPFVLARKPGKLPNETFKKDFDLEYGSTSIEIQINTAFKNSDRIVIVDDLVATGGTAIACAELLTENFKVQKSNILILGVIDLSSLGGGEKIKEEGYNFHALVTY